MFMFGEDVDLRALITAAKGNRSLMSFAKDANISYPKLYRLFEHKIKRPVDDKTLISIAENASPDSNVTFEKLRKACDYIVGINDSWENEGIRIFKIKTVAEDAIWRKVSSNYDVILQRVQESRTNDPGSQYEKDFFDFAIKVRRNSFNESTQAEQTLFFKVCDYTPTLHSLKEINTFTGVVINYVHPLPNERYYLVYVDDREQSMLSKIQRCKQLIDACPNNNGLSISVIFLLIDDNGFYHLQEINIGNEDRLVIINDDIIDFPEYFDPEKDEDYMQIPYYVDPGPYVE